MGLGIRNQCLVLILPLTSFLSLRQAIYLPFLDCLIQQVRISASNSCSIRKARQHSAKCWCGWRQGRREGPSPWVLATQLGPAYPSSWVDHSNSLSLRFSLSLCFFSFFVNYKIPLTRVKNKWERRQDSMGGSFIPS